MVCDGFRWFPMIPDLVWPSGSDLEWPRTDPDPTWGGHGPIRIRIWIGLDPIGSDWIGLDRVRIDLDWIWIGSWSDLGPSWMQTDHVECEKSLFPTGFCMFYVWEMSAFMQYWGQLEANLSPPGAMSVLLWTVLGPTSPILGPTWAQMGRSWRQLGVSWGHLGANLGQPSVTWSRSKAI